MPEVPPPEHGRAALICLPPSGAGRSFFRRWPRRIAGVGVLAISRPGHEERGRLPQARSIAEAAADTAERISQLGLDRVVLFGHSLGAVVAFETACLLQAGRTTAVAALVLSARQAPQLAGPAAQLGELDDATLLASVAQWGRPELADPAGPLAGLLLPALRSDFALSAGYRWQGGQFHGPVSAISYQQDTVVSGATMAGWAAASAGGQYRQVELPGDHYAAAEPSAQLIDIVGEHLI